MSHSHQKISIIAGYKRINYLVGNYAVQIPSNKLLEELVNFPEVEQCYPHHSDPFNVEFYRIRDRDDDLDNQLLLQQFSNSLVDDLTQRVNEQSEINLANIKVCERNNIDYPTFKYCSDVLDYVRRILPGANPDQDAISQALTALPEFLKKGSMHDVVMGEKGRKYLEKGIATHQSFLRRFSDYRCAYHFINHVNSVATTDERSSAVIAETSQAIKNNEKLKRVRTKKGQIRIEFTKYSNAETFSLELETSDNLVCILRDLASNSSDYIAVSMFKILTQCLFCNRFHLQDPIPKISRYCDRDECNKKNKAWVQSHKTPLYADIVAENISPSGF
jgi:hypothetical protein